MLKDNEAGKEVEVEKTEMLRVLFLLLIIVLFSETMFF